MKRVSDVHCPCCGGVAKVIDKRETKYMSQFRMYRCTHCKIKFKSSEKPIFESLPSEWRQRFLNTGERK